MMFKPLHFGLFFSPKHVEYAQQNAARDPFLSAFIRLRQGTADGAAAVQLAGLRYRFLGDRESGEIALTAMERLLEDAGEATSYLNAIWEALLLAQTTEMLSDHPALQPALLARWRDAIYERAGVLNERVYGLSYLEVLWLGLLNMAVGVVLEREPIFERGAQVYRDAVSRDISPRGHIEPLTKRGELSVMYRSVLGVEALVMMAELAAHVGVDLWGYEVRGVSVMTGALYPMYYFYVTEKWTWEEITPEEVQAVFRAHGGYLEVVNKRYAPRDIKPLLEDLRPLVDPLAGSMPTLTHGVAARRGLFG
jgi:hypothetical protein